MKRMDKGEIIIYQTPEGATKKEADKKSAHAKFAYTATDGKSHDVSTLFGSKTPKVLNVNNPVQAEGAARGRESRPAPHNPVGVELRNTVCCAPTAHSVSELYHYSPSCATLARGYQKFASYGGLGYGDYSYSNLTTQKKMTSNDRL
jgi:hypothetical protein